MREIAANVLVVGLSIGILFHFYRIISEGSVTIYETNTLILSLEIAMFIGFIAFAVVNITKRWRGK